MYSSIVFLSVLLSSIYGIDSLPPANTDVPFMAEAAANIPVEDHICAMTPVVDLGYLRVPPDVITTVPTWVSAYTMMDFMHPRQFLNLTDEGSAPGPTGEMDESLATLLEEECSEDLPRQYVNPNNPTPNEIIDYLRITLKAPSPRSSNSFYTIIDDHPAEPLQAHLQIKKMAQKPKAFIRCWLSEVDAKKHGQLKFTDEDIENMAEAIAVTIARIGADMLVIARAVHPAREWRHIQCLIRLRNCNPAKLGEVDLKFAHGAEKKRLEEKAANTPSQLQITLY